MLQRPIPDIDRLLRDLLSALSAARLRPAASCAALEPQMLFFLSELWSLLNDTTWSEVEQSGGYAQIFAIERLRLYRVIIVLAGLWKRPRASPRQRWGTQPAEEEKKKG